MKPTTQVRVGVRIRPLTNSDHSLGGKRVVSSQLKTVTIAQRNFTFDTVFDRSVTQSDLYDQVAPPLLTSFLEGYNATIMAYGQTGSGKTYTMGSQAQFDGRDFKNAGLIPRFMETIFTSLRNRKNESDLADALDDTGRLLEYKVSASFLEVYGEEIHDLLNEERKALPLREDSEGGIVVSGLRQQDVSTSSEALNVLKIGTTNRSTAETLMNLTSSRSHAVFTVYLTQTFRTEKAEAENDLTTTSKFTFVDLAGSERMKKTGAVGERAKEGIMINQGLLALGNVINALADGEKLTKKQKIHVPYRQSKLTRLLQDALGGNSQTLFLACISPSDKNASETLSTLKYANRARNIKNAPTKNIDPSALELQRLYSLTYLLKTELVKHRFGSVITERIGEEDEELMKQKEVNEYLDLIYLVASENKKTHRYRDLTPSVPSLPSLVSSPTVGVGAQVTRFETGGSQEEPLSKESSGTTSAQNQSILSGLVVQVDGVNPTEEMAILDQLLQIQQRNQKYDEARKNDKDQLKEVNINLEKEESMLLQLKESLRVYHSMKENYEHLMIEVQQLETAKTLLANQFAHASADPSKGCSLAIKKKLERVERNLTRARADARKHQQMYRKAEQEALKCKRLERKIDEMKRSKVALVKKQKEATLKHKEFTDAKTREVLAMKRTQRNNDKKLSKFETEISVHKNNLVKRKAYCERLASKLKTAEDQLIKLLGIRKRDLKDRTHQTSAQRPRSQENEPFATNSDEVVTMLNIFNGMVADHLSQHMTVMQYQERVAQYGLLTKSLVTQMNKVQHLRQQSNEIDDDKIASPMDEIEESIEDVELRLELVSADIEEMRPIVDDISKEGGNNCANMMRQKVGTLEGPMARSLLLDFFEQVATLEGRQRNLEISVRRKDSTIQALHQELDTMRERMRVLTMEYRSRHEPPLSADQTGKNGFHAERASGGTRNAGQDIADASSINRDLVASRQAIHTLEEELAVTKAKLALTTVLRQQDKPHPAETKLEALQTILHQLGVSSAEREKLRSELSTCVEDFVDRRTREANMSLKFAKEAVEKKKTELRAMHLAIGEPFEDTERGGLEEISISQRLDEVTGRVECFLPKFLAAVERKEQLVRDVHQISSSLGVKQVDLTANLQKLTKFHQKGAPSGGKVKMGDTDIPQRAGGTGPVAGPSYENDDDDLGTSSGDDLLTAMPIIDLPNSLETRFLDDCELELKELRFVKSQLLVENVRLRDATKRVAKDMNVSADGMLSLVQLKGLPSWWDHQTASEVVRSVTSSDGVVKATNDFTRHLVVVKNSVSSVSESRRALSEALKDVLERAQQTLLATVGEEFGASEEYTTFHKALFKLPSLSQEHIQACISELTALVPGVDAMIQSEIEALTVVWEVLGVESLDRGTFWGKLDEWTRKQQAKNRSQIYEAIQNGEEEWLVHAAKESCGVCDELNLRLLKLERVHNEVEKLRNKQDRKSKIISLDSEIRILSASLADFEEKQCSKQRLLTKKTGSISLLKEERFRKHMQATFSVKLNQLAEQLKEWNETEVSDLHDSILSDEVKHLLLGGPEKMESIVEQRTEFMHLRTIQSNANGKRPPESPSPEDTNSPTKKCKKTDGSAQGASTATSDNGRVLNRVVEMARCIDAPTASSLKRSRSTKERNKGLEMKRSKKTSPPESSPKKARFRRLPSTNRRSAKRTPLSPNLTVDNRQDPSLTRYVPTKGRDTIVPFGDILSSPGGD